MGRMILFGCHGHMGRAVAELCAADPELEIAAGVDPMGGCTEGFPVYAAPAACPIPADVAMDFSHPAALDDLLRFCLGRTLPLVLATTGHSQAQLRTVEQAARSIPIFRCANMSFGISVLGELVRRAAAALPDFDVEIVERHHRRKVDAPSGTALMLAQAAASALPYDPVPVYDRHGLRAPRDRREIGFSSLRGGTIAGDHTVLFAGLDETLELTHHAASRSVYAAGAVRAAKFLAGVKAPGLYDMSALIG